MRMQSPFWGIISPMQIDEFMNFLLKCGQQCSDYLVLEESNETCLKFINKRTFDWILLYFDV